MDVKLRLAFSERAFGAMRKPMKTLVSTSSERIRNSRASGQQNDNARPSLSLRRLRYEHLEQRTLLAGDVLVRLEFVDTFGVPMDSLEVGDDFLLQAYVQDIRSPAGGLFQAYFDFFFDSELVSVIGSVGHGTQYTVNASGKTSFDDGSVVAGMIDQVGGRTSGVPDPFNGSFLLFSVPFHADANGALTLHPSYSADTTRRVEFFDTLKAIPLNMIDFEGTNIEIGDRADTLYGANYFGVLTGDGARTVGSIGTSTGVPDEVKLYCFDVAEESWVTIRLTCKEPGSTFETFASYLRLFDPLGSELAADEYSEVDAPLTWGGSELKLYLSPWHILRRCLWCTKPTLLTSLGTIGRAGRNRDLPY